MRWSFRIGTIAGIRVELHVTFLLFVVWIAVTQGLLGGGLARAAAAVVLLLLVFSCVLLHELGHALTARRFGVATRDIVLLPIGGVARLAGMPRKPSQEMQVALAGPAVNVVIALLLYAVISLRGGAVVAPLMRGDPLATLLVINVWMVLFNLIPAFPMDGGRVLRAALAMRIPYVKATRIAAGIGQGIAFLFGALGVFGIPGVMTANPMLMLVALFVFIAASEENGMVATRSSLEGLPVRAAMLTDFHRLDVREPLGRAVDYLMAGSQQDFPVMDGEAPIGVLSRADLLLGLQKDGADLPVGAAVRREAEFADATESLEAAMMRMRGSRQSALPVLQQGRLVGLLTLENVSELLLVRSALQRYAGRT